MECCKDWKENIEKVTAPAMLLYARNPHHYPDGRVYDGKQFIFCPWCGKKRRETDEQS